MHNRNLHHIHWSRRAWYRAAGGWLCLTGQQDRSDGPMDVGIEFTRHLRAGCC